MPNLEDAAADALMVELEEILRDQLRRDVDAYDPERRPDNDLDREDPGPRILAWLELRRAIREPYPEDQQ